MEAHDPADRQTVHGMESPTSVEEAGPATACAAHPIMFWVLISLALVVFAPCVLLPMWVESEALRAREQGAAAQVAALQSQMSRLQAAGRAMMEDPLVNERVARRQLNYRASQEQVVQWQPAENIAAIPAGPGQAGVNPYVAPPSTLVGIADRLQRWLPAWPYRKLFVESPNRQLMLVMAGGLLVAAFVLFSPLPIRLRSRHE